MTTFSDGTPITKHVHTAECEAVRWASLASDVMDLATTADEELKGTLSHGLLRHVMRNIQDITLKGKQRLATLIAIRGADHVIRYQDDIDYQQ